MKPTENTERRNFLKNSLLLTATGLVAPFLLKANKTSSIIKNNDIVLPDGAPFTLPALPYDYNALEPHIDAMTMQIHHDKHHAAYVTNLNKAIAENGLGNSVLEPLALDNLIKNISKYPIAIRNNGGGHWNHSFFWKSMKANGTGQPTGKLADAINNTFTSLDNLKTKFNEAGAKRFGSGWAWLYVTKDGKLDIGSTPNQDNPLMDVSDIKGTPVLALDVWEHAYYLKYQNKRADYITAWWNLVNWDQANQNFEAAK
ncbi:MAG TPA: superoxide dismutase [Bacteroidia bacterium]|jgi:Fe-Mn family superoxide dismutase|nr:superoxide dismutase [Bacteroidia bacterium]